MSVAARLPRWADVALLPAVTVASAFVVAGLVVLAIGQNPLEATRILLVGAFGSWEGLGYTLYYATSFMFAGLAVAVAFHAGLFNIGVDGQAYVAGLGALAVAHALGFLPAPLLATATVLAMAAVAAAYALVPAWLQAKRGSHVVITTIMLNYVASALMGWLLVRVFIEPGQMNAQTSRLPPGSDMPEFWRIASWLGADAPKTPLNLSILLAGLAGVGVWALLWRSRLGFRLRAFGANPAAAHYGGVSSTAITLQAMAISGALASGLAVNAILGQEHRLILDFTAGFGFVGIAVALMGRGHPAGIALAALLFGTLYQGGEELAFDMPSISRDMVVLIQGLVVLFAGAMENAFRGPLAAAIAGFGRAEPPAPTSVAAETRADG
ncbi:MAG: ABC transporter permease [Hyphomicrobiales bacterium]|nr:ABC transporter permease [Hyphomicrobiales bacterium]MDE2017335.1 ABC transporter permease [Hyphomicrobiales bacterium]